MEQDYEQNDSSMFDIISNAMSSSASNNDSSINDDVDMLLDSAIGNDTVWNRFTSTCHPFPSLQAMVLHALLNGDNDMISHRGFHLR
jgi:hypothetical protein